MPNAFPLALADRCVRCGLCLPHCPTYRHARVESEGPRGRIAIMAAVAREEISPSATARAHIDSCLGCGHCEAVCPANVQYLELRDQYRSRYGSRFAHWKAALLSHSGLLRWLRKMSGPLRRWPRQLGPLGLRRGLALLHSAPPAHLPRTNVRATQSATQLFASCQSALLDAQSLATLSSVFSQLDQPLALADSGCCGALPQHEGALNTAEQRRLALRAESATLVAVDSGCIADLKRSGRNVAEACRYLLEHWPDHWEPKPLSLKVAVHLPCTHQNGCGDTAAVTEVLARIPGLQSTVISGLGCCGAGGMQMLANPAHAKVYAERLLADLPAGVDVLVSSNIGCRVHLRQHAPHLPVKHPLELLAQSLGIRAHSMA